MLILCIATICLSCGIANSAEISITNTMVNVTDVPDNAAVIVTSYSNKVLNGIKLYRQSGSISANYADDLGEARDAADKLRAYP